MTPKSTCKGWKVFNKRINNEQGNFRQFIPPSTLTSTRAVDPDLKKYTPDN